MVMMTRLRSSGALLPNAAPSFPCTGDGAHRVYSVHTGTVQYTELGTNTRYTCAYMLTVHNAI